MPIGMITDMDLSKRESLLSILRDVSPNVDTYLVQNLKVGANAMQPLHEWVTYNTARPTSVTFTVEGADLSVADLTAPSRSNNRTAIVTDPVVVSLSEVNTNIAVDQNPWDFQKEKALLRLRAKMEYAIVNGAYATGSSGVARGLAGIDTCVSTNVTARASGTSFTETELNDILNDSWTAVGSEYVADVLLAPMVIKRRISSFVTNTRNISAKEKRLTAEVQVYDSQVGKSVMIIPHKDVRAVGGSLTVYAIREDLFSLAFLKNSEPQFLEVAQTGLAKKGQYWTEFTLVSHAQNASAKRTGYNTSL